MSRTTIPKNRDKRPPVPTERLIFDEHEGADYLNTGVRNLRAGRQGRGAFADLPYLKFGKMVRYRRRDMDRKIEESLVEPEVA